MSEYGNGLSDSNKNKDEFSSILKIDANAWQPIHADTQKNVDFFHKKKTEYLNDYINHKFTSNYDIIPRLPFPLTTFFVTMLSTFYNDGTMIKDAGGKEIIGINIISLKQSLNHFQKQRFLQEVGFIRIQTGAELKFEKVTGTDIVYNFSWKKICVRREQNEDMTATFEYYELKNGKWYGMSFTSRDFFSLDYDNMLNMDSDKKEMLNATTPEVYAACPIIPFFGNLDKFAYPSVFVAFDEVFTTLISFGLAGAPMSLLVKIYVKNNDLNSNKAKYDAFGDLLTMLELGKDDEVNKVDTGDLTSLKNFFTVFEASLAWLGRMVGVSTTVVSSQMNETRKSGSAKFVDNTSAEIFRSSYILDFDEFESRLFDACQKLNPKLKQYDFNVIDKSNDKLMMDHNSFVDGLVQEVRNMMMPYEDAIAKRYNVGKEKAKSIAAETQEQWKKYFPYGMGVGEKGMEDKAKASESSSAPFNLQKKDLNGDGAKNIVED